MTTGEATQADKELVAVLVPDMSDFYNQVFKGIQSVADELHYLPVVISCGNNPSQAESIYTNISARSFAGVINISLGFSDAFYEKFRKDKFLEVPLVFVDDFNAASHRVLINTSDAIKQATSHMLGHGYRDIALINCPDDWPIGREVMKGYSQTFYDTGIKVSPDRLFSVPDFSHAAGLFCAEQILRSPHLPHAVVAASDALALGAITAFQKNGLDIPEDIAIIGYNDIPPSSSTNPTLSTINLPSFEIGAQAMTTLINILQGKVKNWEQHEFSGKLITRESCGCKK